MYMLGFQVRQRYLGKRSNVFTFASYIKPQPVDTQQLGSTRHSRFDTDSQIAGSQCRDKISHVGH